MFRNNLTEFEKFSIARGVSSNTLNDYKNNINNMTPYVIEERPGNFRAIDVFTRLISDRIIFLGSGVDDQVANILTAQMLFLESVDSKKDITMYVNSPGGSVYAGLGIYDTMQYINPDVSTICTGLAASMGAVLLCGGAEGKRAALPHSRVMIHQPMGGIAGGTQASDFVINTNEIVKLKDELYEIMSKHSGKSKGDIEKNADRDYWMKASEAKEYGMIDEVLEKK